MTNQQVIEKPDAKIYPEVEYYGKNGHDVYKRMWPDGDSKRLPLEPSLKIIDHSPTGFSWGYHGQGPAQLALALLLDATDNPETAQNYYQDFKFSLVAGWSKEWIIFRSDILNWLRNIQELELTKRQGGN